MKEILYDARWIGITGSGDSRSELQKLLSGLGCYQGVGGLGTRGPAFFGAALWKQRPRLFFSQVITLRRAGQAVRLHLARSEPSLRTRQLERGEARLLQHVIRPPVIERRSC